MVKDDIKKVVIEAYIEGVYIERNIEAMEKGFHPAFNMIIMNENDIKTLPIKKWIEFVKQSLEKNPNPPKRQITYDITEIDVTENCAVAKVEIFIEDKIKYTDYLSLYKFHEGWRIVSKTFYDHQEN